MGTSNAQMMPDHKTLLLSALLIEYLARLSDNSVSATEKMHIRWGLEMQIESISSMSPSTAFYLQRALDQAFSVRADFAGTTAAVDWYLDFLSGRDEQWMKEVQTYPITRFWKSLPNSPLRDKALHVLLLTDLANEPNRPELSMICKLFSEVGDSESTPLSEDRRAIARCLLQEALGAPADLTAEIVNARFFCLRALRFCLQPNKLTPVTREQIAEVLGMVGNLGPSIQAEFEGALAR